MVTGTACAPRRLEAAGALHGVVATVRDDASRWLFGASWGVDAAISAASALVTLIEEATGPAQTVILADLAGAGLALVETTITTAPAARGKTVADLRLPPGDTVAAVVRHGRTIPAGPAFRFRAGDPPRRCGHLNEVFADSA